MTHVRVNRRRQAATNGGTTMSGNSATHRSAAAIDRLADYQEFCAEILPALRKDLKAGLTDRQILEKYRAVAAARLVSHAASTENPAISLAACKDVLDRGLGKATEKVEHTHRMSSLKDEELDALLATEISDLKEVTALIPSGEKEE